MKSIVIAAFVAAGMTAAGTVSAQEALAKSSGCLTCHDIAAKKVGPAFKETAAKYKGKADAEAKLVTMLKTGGPDDHNKVVASDADLKSIVSIVLTSK